MYETPKLCCGNVHNYETQLCIAGMIADGESIKHTIKCTAEMHKKSLALICMLSNCIYTCLHVLQ